jgi:HlyD family secretion protein
MTINATLRSDNRLPAAILLCLCLIATGCASRGVAKESMPPSVVQTIVAARRDLSTSLVFDGQIAPLLTSTLSSPQSGNVTAVYVNEGDRVRQGALLAKIDDSTLRAQLAQAQGQSINAQSVLHSSEISQPIQSVRYGSTLGQARARVDADRAALTNTKLVYDGDKALYPQGYIAQTTLEQARSSNTAAQQQLYQDEAALQAAQIGLRQAQADLQNVASNRGTLEQARGLMQQIRAQIEQTNIYAPFDGIVTARLLDPGAFAGPNQPIVTVSHLATVYVNFNIPDDALDYVRPGTRVAFTTATIPGKTFFGTVFDLNAIPSQGTLSYRARLRCPNPEGKFRGGMLVSAVVPKERRESVIVIPRTAIFQADGQDNVFTAQGDKAVRVPVRVGLRTDDLAEVRGLPPGTHVITSRPDSLQNGGRIIVDALTRP